MKLPISIPIPDGFLKAETRCGYAISEKQKKIWAVELDLLSRLLQVCEKHNIKAIVYAGTLLGAIRHGGFIPWDDDLDVAMDRDNFNKLCSVACQEFSEPYFFQTALTDRKRFISEARLRNSRTTACVKGQETVDYNNGIYIDVHVIDGIVARGWRRTFQNVAKRVLRKGLVLYYQDDVGNLVYAIARLLFRTFSYESVYNMYQRVLAMYTKSSEWLGLVTHGDWFMDRYYLSKKDLDCITAHDFEGISVPIPCNYDDILTRTYGDYMTFPPEVSRGAWHEGRIFFDPDSSYLDVLRGR